MPKFERRESQQLMMKEIYTALRDSRFSLIEAGTGTGKTLAYLLPSLYFAKKRRTCHYKYTNGTTPTTNIRKRNSVITKIMPFSFEVALLKEESIIYAYINLSMLCKRKKKIMIWHLQRQRF